MMFASIEIFCGLANKFDRGIKVHVCLQRALSVSFSFRQFNKVVLFEIMKIFHEFDSYVDAIVVVQVHLVH